MSLRPGKVIENLREEAFENDIFLGLSIIDEY